MSDRRTVDDEINDLKQLGVVTFPEGTAVLNLHGLVETVIPVVVDYGGRRFALTGWNDEYGVFDAIEMQDGESPQEARRRVLSNTGETE